ncbi:MAG: NUDIX domain-containing protein [Desulfarculaceae bacterium]|nr:NUDIX domain-containing protein [Desulfarculaceae bacterium]MCF8072327.1 NUDIX domain-containing protein [Desulfarculaceae bacterium]MCF8100248.1 NUDIX domain-containing protein [Desulfarculaceae bacterium]MCF8116179.1 NUDIX domain-containing protein [Desulfarculaceae bacterium]
MNSGGAPFYCSGCGSPVYEDPKVAVAVIVENGDGLLLLRRAQHDQAHGKWILPGGHVDRGEVVARAGVREVAEETGLEVEISRLVGVYSYQDNPWVLVVYAARPVGGELSAGPEALEIRHFTPEELPWDELGYLSTAHALKDHLSRG